MRSLEIPDIFLDDEIDCDPAHEICTTCILDGYFSVLQSPCVTLSCPHTSHFRHECRGAGKMVSCGHYSGCCFAFINFLIFDQAVNSENLVVHSKFSALSFATERAVQGFSAIVCDFEIDLVAISLLVQWLWTA